MAAKLEHPGQPPRVAARKASDPTKPTGQEDTPPPLISPERGKRWASARDPASRAPAIPSRGLRVDPPHFCYYFRPRSLLRTSPHPGTSRRKHLERRSSLRGPLSRQSCRRCDSLFCHTCGSASHSNASALMDGDALLADSVLCVSQSRPASSSAIPMQA